MKGREGAQGSCKLRKGALKAKEAQKNEEKKTKGQSPNGRKSERES